MVSRGEVNSDIRADSCEPDSFEEASARAIELANGHAS